MAWTTPVDYSTGQVITAAIWNNLIGSGGNIDETAPAKVTTAGDLVYGTGANAIARLGVGSANQVLKVNSGATAPEWSAVAASELTAGNDKVFYSNSSGVVTELALGDSGTVLTSNGTTSAPTFTASAAGGSRSFTATGAISGAGLLVAENADGTVSTVADTRAGGTTTTLALVTGSDNNPWASTCGYDPDSGSAWMVYIDNNRAVWATAGSISGSTISWGSRVRMDDPIYGNKQQIAATLDPVNDKVWVMYCDDTVGHAYVASFTISGSTITKNSGGSEQIGANNWAHDQGSVRLVWDSTNNQMIAINGTYGFNEFEIAAVSETAGTITVGTETHTAVTAIYTMDCVWDSVSERLVATTTNGSGTAYIHSWSESGGVYSADVTNGAAGTGWTTQAPSMNSSILLNSETANKCTFVCEDSSGYIASRTFTVAAGSITAVTAQVRSSKSIGATYYQRFGWSWDSNSSEYSLAYITSGGDVYFDTITIDNATSEITYINPTVTAESDMSRYVSYRGGYLTSTYSNQNLFGGRNTSTSRQNYLLSTVRSGSTTANKFVGISEAAVSDGATGDFTIVGGVNTSVSSLTAPNNYFIQGDGTLGVAADSPNYGLVGRALSSTSILVTGVGDTTVSSA